MKPGTYAMNAITNSANPKPSGLDSSFNQGWDSFTDIAAQASDASRMRTYFTRTGT